MDDTDLALAHFLSILESEPKDTLRGFPGDELDALDDAINDHMLNSRVFTLSVLTDQDGVDVVVWCLVTSDRPARADVGEEVECATEGKVQRNVALANWGLFILFLSWLTAECVRKKTYRKRSLESNKILLHTLNGLVGDDGLPVLYRRSDIDWLPFNWRLLFKIQLLYVRKIRTVPSPTFAAAKISLTDFEISGPMPSPSINVTV